MLYYYQGGEINMYDIVIIGAGVIGSSIAYNLGKYQLKTLVLEKEDDIAMHASKANSGIIHSGYDCRVGTLKAQLNVKGNRMYPALAKELNFPLQMIGSLVLAFDEEEAKHLQILLTQGKANGINELYLLEHNQILAIEPNIDTSVYQALFAPNAGITCPYQTTLAFAKSAAINQVEYRLNYQVSSIRKANDVFKINNEIDTRYIINAAGVYSDEIAKLVNDNDYKITPRKGEYLLLDKTAKLFNHVLFQVPSNMGKGVLITPTVDDNTLVGPTAVDIEDKEDDSVTELGIQTIKQKASKTSSKIDFRNVITEFSGIRAVCGDDFIIEESHHVKNFINLIGIASPGLASAPAIGEYVIDLLRAIGLKLVLKDDYHQGLKAPIRTTELSIDEYDRLIKEKPLYGKIVCRCEVVSEQEIIDAITGILPATTLDGVKRRTRAGMGRCQSGFCSIRTLELLSAYQHQSMLDINKSTINSKIVLKPSKGDNNHE